MFDLVVLDESGEVTLTRSLGSEPIYLGRAPHNDVVLADPAVSSRHLAAWATQGRAFVEDLGSRNGTWLEGARVRGVRSVEAPCELRLGDALRVRVIGTGAPEERDSPVLLVQASDGSISVPMRHDRFVFGPGVDAHLRVDVDPTETVVLMMHPDGDLWLGRHDDQQLIAVGEPFEVGGKTFVIRGSPARVTVTREQDAAYTYRLIAELSGPTGPRALLEESRADRRHEVDAGTRAVLLYLLARRRHQDAVDGVPETHRGWCADGELASGIWGRAADNKNLNVLVTRLRAEVREAGFDPWFVEKRRGHTRVRLDDVEVR